MPRSTRTALIAVVLLGLAALLATLWIQPPAAGPEVAAPPPAAPSAAEPPSAPAERAESAPTESERTDLAAEREPPWARVFVEGELRGGGIELEHTIVIVRPGPLTPATRGAAAALAGWTKPDAAGRFRLELSHCFARDAERFPSALNVQISTDGRMPIERDVPVAFGRAELELGGELVVRADVAVPNPCSLSGLALGADRTPLAVQLAAFRVTRSRLDGEPLALGSCDAEGRFELQVECEARVQLLAFADGWRPASVVVEPGGGWVGELVLGRGAVVAGRLVQGEVPLEASLALWPAPARTGRGSALTESGSVPAAGGSVTAHLTEFVLIDGRLEWSSLGARSDAEGRFRVAGLAPGAYLIRITVGFERPQAEFVRVITVPDPALVIDLALAQVGLEVYRGDAPAENAELDVELMEPGGPAQRQRMTSGQGGVCVFTVAPRTHVRVFSPDGRLLGELDAGPAGSLEHERISL